MSFPVQDEKKAGRFLIVPVVEHCREEHRKEACFDGQSGERKDFSYALHFNKKEILELSSFSPDGIIIAPEIRASFVTRQIMGEAIRPLQADEIQEEEVIIENLELYFRPVFAFEFRWQAKEKTGIAEFDGLTGEMRTGGKMWRERLKKLDTNVLFDIGADVLGMVFPGGNIAVKLTKAAIDYKKGK